MIDAIYGEKKGRITYLIQVIGKRDCLVLFACAELKSTFGLLQAFLHQLLSEKYFQQGSAASKPVTIRLRYKTQSRGQGREHRASCEDPVRRVCRSCTSPVQKS